FRRVLFPSPRTRQPDQATRQHQPGVRHQLGPCPSQHEAARGVLEALDYSHLNVLVTTPIAITAHAANTMIGSQPPGSPANTARNPSPNDPDGRSSRTGRAADGYGSDGTIIPPPTRSTT